MKLSEIKIALIEQFFSENSNGISAEALNRVVESLSNSIGLNLEKVLENHPNHSNDPSKAFKRFTEGKSAVLSILEKEDLESTAFFTAVRVGRVVKIANLTTSPILEKDGSFTDVKHALRQAKNINEDVFFNIIVGDSKL